MNIHKNARLTPLRREEMARRVVAGQLTQAQAAAHYGVSAKVVARWVRRFKHDGPEGMMDRSSRPHRLANQTPQPVVERIIALRRQRLTGKHIAHTLKKATRFCDAYASWQKGAVENINSRPRRDLPRTLDIDKMSHEDLQDIALMHNLTPRKCIDFKNPYQALLAQLNINAKITFNRRVALRV